MNRGERRCRRHRIDTAVTLWAIEAVPAGQWVTRAILISNRVPPDADRVRFASLRPSAPGFLYETALRRPRTLLT
jgi:hypothetical protein